MSKEPEDLPKPAEPELFSDLGATMHIKLTPEDLKTATQNSSRRKKGRRPVAKVSSRARGADLGSEDFHELLHHIYDAVLLTDTEGNIVSSNARAHQFFECNEGHFWGKSLVDVLFGADESLLATIIENLKQDRFTLIEVYCLRRDGSVFPSEISANNMTVSGRELLCFFIRDISTRKETENRMRAGYNAIQNAGSGIAIVNFEGKLLYGNPSLRKLWGLGDGEALVGLDIRSMMEQEREAEELIAQISAGTPQVGEFRMRRSDRSLFYAQISAAGNMNMEGELTGLVLSLQDVTDQKQAKEQLEIYAQELQIKNRQLEHELDMARDIQQAFLPRSYPLFPQNSSREESALRFGHIYIPSGAVGGDYFDIRPISDTQAGIFFGDVAGHGLVAALVVSTVRGLIEEMAPLAANPGEFITQLNRAFVKIFSLEEDCLFVSALYCVIDISTGTLQYTSAGHPPPYLLKRNQGLVEPLQNGQLNHGPGIGLSDDITYSFGECRLAPNDLLLMYTDGLYEAEGPDEEQYETDRLQRAVDQRINLPPDQLLNELVNDVRAFTGRQEFDDDVCLLGVEMTRLLQASN